MSVRLVTSPEPAIGLPRSRGTSLVGLFIAGVQKAATTSLYAHFAEHPQLAAGEAKELHFFDDESEDWERPDYERLHRRFAAEAPGRLRFDATPIYFFWPPALQRIRRYNPGARFIVLVREPIARAFSGWCMEARRGVEPLSFGEAIRGGRARLPHADPLAHAWRVHSYVERGLYGEQAERAFRLFPREQFLFLRTSDLAADHRATLDRVSAFLGLAPFPDTGPKREHQRPADQRAAAVHPDDAAYLRALYAPDTRRFAALTGVRVDHWPSGCDIS